MRLPVFLSSSYPGHYACCLPAVSLSFFGFVLNGGDVSALLSFVGDHGLSFSVVVLLAARLDDALRFRLFFVGYLFPSLILPRMSSFCAASYPGMAT